MHANCQGMLLRPQVVGPPSLLTSDLAHDDELVLALGVGPSRNAHGHLREVAGAAQLGRPAARYEWLGLSTRLIDAPVLVRAERICKRHAHVSMMRKSELNCILLTCCTVTTAT